METTREIALRTFNEFMFQHKDDPMVWNIWKAAFDMADAEIHKQMDNEIRSRLLKINPQIQKDSKYTNPFLHHDTKRWYEELSSENETHTQPKNETDEKDDIIQQLLEACHWAKAFGKNGSTHDIMILNKLNLAIEKATKQH